MESNSSKTWYYAIGAVVVIILVLIIVSAMNNSGGSNTTESTATSTDMSDLTGSTTSATSTGLTGSVASSTSTSSAASLGPLAFAVTTSSSTYSTNESFKINVTVFNLTDATTTLHFADGCVATYSIAGFDMLAHTTCLPNPVSFAVPPHDAKQATVVHYPSVFKIPPGKYYLTARIIGYGGATVPITITP
ncbi:MAG: hypothetical protein KGJ33_03280 [Patescibacteria group bacterium]|nr:hypothetical protein [Patescibacteria group bacterium]